MLSRVKIMEFLVGLFFMTACSNFYVETDPIEPQLNLPIPIFNGAYSWADLLALDSTGNGPVKIQRTILEKPFDFTDLIPKDSLFIKLGNTFNFPAALEIAETDSLNYKINQLDFIQLFAPQNYSDFASNNLSSIPAPSFSDNGAVNVSPNKSWGSIHANVLSGTASFTLGIENEFDFDLNFRISIVTAGDTIFQKDLFLESKDSLTEVFSKYNQTIGTHVSTIVHKCSTSAGKTLISIDNSNELAIKLKANTITGRFGSFKIPKSITIDSAIEKLGIGCSNGSDLNLFVPELMTYDYNIQAIGIIADLRLERVILDKNGILNSETIVVPVSNSPFNWPMDLSNLLIRPLQGEIEIQTRLYMESGMPIEIQPNRNVTSIYQKLTPNLYKAIEVNQDKTIIISDSIFPYASWPNLIQLSCLPKYSELNTELNLTGWGKVIHNLNVSSEYLGTMYSINESTIHNFGNGIQDSALQKVLNWQLTSTTNNPLINGICAIDPAIIHSTSALTFKKPWGIVFNANNNVSISSTSDIAFDEGSLSLETSKQLTLEVSDELKAMLYSSDSMAIFANVRSTHDTILNYQWEIFTPNDTLLTVDTTTSERIEVQRVSGLNPLLLEQPLFWHFKVQNAGTYPITINYNDSISLNINATFYGELR